jgi:predicted Zn-dependent protease
MKPIWLVVAATALIIGGTAFAKDKKSDVHIDVELAQLQTLAAASQAGADTAGLERRIKAYLQTHPDSVPARLLYARLLYADKRNFACIDQCNRIVASDPNNAEGWHLLGHCYQNVHKPARAVDAYSRYVGLTDDAQYKTLIVLLKQQDTAANSASQASSADNYLPAVTERGVFRWSHTSPITVFVEPPDAVPAYRYDFEESLRQAFEDWSEATAHKFEFVLQDKPDHADITVVWTNDLHAPEFSGEAGYCNFASGSDGVSSARIHLLTVDPFKEAAPVGKEQMHAICLHEIGHALGLQGHSTREGDIMYPMVGEAKVSERDRATLLALYAADAKTLAEAKPVDAYGRELPDAVKAERLVNAGNDAAAAGDWSHAVELLERAVALDGKNALARSNLAISLNNMAIAPGCKSEDAQKLLYRALYWNPGCTVAKDNLANVIYRDTAGATAAEHVRRAGQRQAAGDLMGAIVEYRWALERRDDAAVRSKMQQAEKLLSAR